MLREIPAVSPLTKQTMRPKVHALRSMRRGVLLNDRAAIVSEDALGVAGRERLLDALAWAVVDHGWRLFRAPSWRTGCCSSNLSNGTKNQQSAVKAALMKISRV
jgi:hypothetical protein